MRYLTKDAKRNKERGFSAFEEFSASSDGYLPLQLLLSVFHLPTSEDICISHLRCICEEKRAKQLDIIVMRSTNAQDLMKVSLLSRAPSAKWAASCEEAQIAPKYPNTLLLKWLIIKILVLLCV